MMSDEKGMDEKVYILNRIRPIGRNSKRVMLEFEGADSFALYKGELKRLGLCEGDCISESQYLSIAEEILLPRARKRVLHLLEKQDRTKRNLTDKLTEGGYPESVALEAIAYAMSYNYVDDDRYARNYIYYHKGDRSKRKLKTDLLSKGVPGDIIERVLEEEYDSDEESMVRHLMEKRHYDREHADDKERTRMYRYLASRGFEYSTFADLL